MQHFGYTIVCSQSVPVMLQEEYHSKRKKKIALTDTSTISLQTTASPTIFDAHAAGSKRAIFYTYCCYIFSPAALEPSVGITVSDDEDEEDQVILIDSHESQLIPTATFPTADRKESFAKTPFFSKQLIDATIWLVVLVILWTLNLILFKKTSSAEMVSVSISLD